MASDLSKYLGNQLCRWLAGQAMPSPPAALEISLWNGDPKGAGVEVTRNVRTAGRLAAAFTAPPNDGATNTMASTADVDFGASAQSVTVTHVAVSDASTAGDILASKSVGSNAVQAGQDVKFPAGDLVFTLGS